MKSSMKALTLAVPLCFFMGAWWGFESIQKKVQSHVRPTNELRVLTLEGFFPQSVVNKIRKTTNIQLLITEMESEMELLNEARTNGEVYDIFQVTSYQVDHLRENHSLRKLPPLEGVQQISVDFQRMTSPDSLPLLWAVNGFLVSKGNAADLSSLIKKQQKISLLASEYEAFYQFSNVKPEAFSWLDQNKEDLLKTTLNEFKKQIHLTPTPFQLFQEEPNDYVAIQAPSGPAHHFLRTQPRKGWSYKLPREGANLFTESLTISAKSDKMPLITHFLKALLQPKMVKTLTQSRHMATTLEYKNLPKVYHPRSLRSFPLDRLHVVTQHKVFETSWPHLYREILWPKNIETESK